jgi:hypothetical protein
VHHAPALAAMEPDVAGDRLGVVELDDEASVRLRRRLGAVAELGGLPGLALVLAEVLDHERLHAGDAEEPLACRVDGESAEVACDPAAVELLGDGGGGAGAAEAVEDEVAFLRGSVDYALE